MTASPHPTSARKVVANLALSLDGRINGAAGPHDMGWIVPHALTDAARDHMVRVTSPASTALLGRTNFEGFGQHWPAVADAPDADPRDRAFARWLDAVEKVVVSSTLGEPTWRNARVSREAPSEVVASLRADGEGDIVVLASASVIRELLTADAVDRLSITLCPEVVGGGERLFDDDLGAASAWTLIDHTTSTSGATCLLYDRAR